MTKVTRPSSRPAGATASRATGLRAAAFLTALGCGLLAASPAAAKFDPAHRWRTAETPHFVLHFHEGLDELAGRAAAVAEEAHERLAPRIGWTPRSRTQLIIADDTDAAQGWSTPYPYNQILISPAAPSGEFGLGATRFDDWLRLVITHEYVHTLQLDLASRLPLALRSIFGRLYFPNALQPQWLVEGLATLEETELTAGGRGHSPGAEMVLRMAALEGPFPTLDQMAVFPDAWPAGQVPYLFGESFLRHLSERFGRGKVAELSLAYGGRPLPFLVESTGRGVLGEGYPDLWREWVSQLTARFSAQQRAVAASGATASTALTDSGYLNGAPSWSPDGARIAWLRADGRERPGLWVMSSDGSEQRRLAASSAVHPSSGAAPRWSPDGRRLYYAKPGYVRGVAMFNDIWMFDLEQGREIRLTRGLRASDPDPSPDGGALVVVTGARGRSRLAILDIDRDRPTAQTSRLRALPESDAQAVSRPRWSRDGRRIAFSARVPSGAEEIRIVDREGREIARTGGGRSLNAGPAWSADGRLVLFSSDRTGIFNLFTWDPASGEVVQISNVVGGAFSPAPAPDGRRLAYVEYSARGYDVHVMNLDAPGNPLRPPLPKGDVAMPAPANAPPAPEDAPSSQGEAAMPGPNAAPPAAPGNVPSPPLPKGDRGGFRLDVGLFASRAYSPADTIAPRLWFPWTAVSPVSGTLAGLITGGQDVLQRHRYALTGLYAPGSGRLMHAADYAYDGFRPTVRLLSWDLDRTYAGLLQGGGAASGYTERSRVIGLEATLGFPGLDSSQAITLGYRHRQLSALTPLPPWPGYDGPQPALGSLGSWRLGWSHDSSHRQPFSISAENGQRLLLGLERYQGGFGSERSFTAGTLDWRGYASLPAPRHALAARLFVGGAAGDSPPQGAFSLGGDAPGEIGYAIDDRTLALRGYPLNAFRGEHAVLAGLEYRFPLLEVGRGGVSAPLFLRRLHGALFVDAGETRDDGGFSTRDLSTGVGAEVRLDLLFSYFLPLTIRLGIAVGLDEQGGVYPTLAVWMPQGLLGTATATQRR